MSLRRPYKKRFTTEERFWAKVDKNGPIPEHRPELGPCSMWTGAHDKYGYGTLRVGGKGWKSNRLAWVLQVGPIPEGLWVLHACDTPACVRRPHLFLGTQFDNMRDCANKGRNGKTLHPETSQGINHGMHKLTEAQVREIRVMYDSGETQPVIAARYGINRSAVSHIGTRRSWKHLP